VHAAAQTPTFTTQLQLPPLTMPAAKRANQGAAAAPAKKKARSNPMLQAIQETITESKTTLTPEVKTMLLAMLPHSLGVAAPERDEHQQKVAAMIASVVEAEQARLEAAVKEQEDNLAAVGSSKETVEAKARSLEEHAKNAIETAQAKEAAVAEAGINVLKAKQAFDEATADFKVCSQAATETKEKKVGMEEVRLNHFQALRDGDWSTAGAKPHLDKLVPMLRSSGFEDSLLSALPGACMKEPTQRGPFDITVLDQLDAQITAKIEELGKSAEEQEKEVHLKQAAMDEKRQTLQGVNHIREEAIERKDEAEEAKCGLEAKLAEATKAALEYEPNLLAAQAVLETRQSELSNFVAYNVGCLQLLLDPPAPKPEKVAPDAQEMTDAPVAAAEVGGA